MKHITTQTAVEESAHDQPLPGSGAAAHANAMPDMEMGNGYGPAEGGESMTEPELELRTGNGGEGIEHFSDQEAHPPVIKSPLTTPRPSSQATQQEEPLCGLLKLMDVPNSQQDQRKRLLNEAPVEKGCRSMLAMIVALLPKHSMENTSIIFLLTGEVGVHSALTLTRMIPLPLEALWLSFELHSLRGYSVLEMERMSTDIYAT